MYLDWFNTATPGWRAKYRTVATTAPFQTPQSMTQAALQDQAVQILQLALERDNRFVEIINQDDGEGAMNYALGMLEDRAGAKPGDQSDGAGRTPHRRAGGDVPQG